MATRPFDRLRFLKELLRSGRAIVLLTVLVVAGIVATAGFTIWHGHKSTLEAHQSSMNSMGVVLAEQTSRYAQIIDLILLEVQARVANLQIATLAEFQHHLGTWAFQTYLAERVSNIPQADAIVLIDANGMILNWSRNAPAEKIDAIDRDYYNHFKENNDPSLFVGSLSKGRATGKLSLFFARRISGPDGSFLGLVLGIVDIQYLSDFYQAAGEPMREAVTLLRRDGTMLMRYPNLMAAVGAKLPNQSPWYDRVARGGGSYFSDGTLDGIPNLISVHPLRDYPLVVDIVMQKTDVFTQWTAPDNFKIEMFVIRVGDWGGYMLLDCDDPLAVHKFCSTLPSFVFEARPVVPVMDAVRVELEAIAFRDGLKAR